MNLRIRPEPILLALLIFGPPVAAYWVYSSGYFERLPRIENTERVILEPVVALPAVPAVAGDGRVVDDVWPGNRVWSVVYARTSTCDSQCFQDLIRLIQVTKALGKYQTRVQRVYLAPGAAPKVMEDESVLVGRLDQPAGANLLGVLKEAGFPPGPNGRVYIVDPKGFLVLVYPPSPDRNGLHDDLQRLLRNT